MQAIPLILPDWPAPDVIRAASSTRLGGLSKPPFDSLNLGNHVGDDPELVAANRRRLAARLGLPAEPYWLEQVHGNAVAVIEDGIVSMPVADAACTRLSDRPLVVMTADCLPMLFCSRDGQEIGVAHGGWRGLAAGVIPALLAHFVSPPADILAWLGPAIGPERFEVGAEVREIFVAQDLKYASAFVAAGEQKYLADIFAIARHQLASAGIIHVHGGDACTVSSPERFFSYRRDGRTGRMASLIWRAGA